MNEFHEMEQDCITFFNELADILKNKYEVVASCNNDCSAYLIPNGTADEISYCSKPAYSFRISDHWNWYANTKKCIFEDYIQCLNTDLMWAHHRSKEKPTAATKPIHAYCVAYCGPRGIYRTIYGQVYDRKTRTWSWVESNPREIVTEFLGLFLCEHML